MTDRRDRRTRHTPEALAYFFTHVAEIRRHLSEPESQEAVDILLAAVRDDGDVEAAARQLHRCIRAEGDALGLYGRTRSLGARLAGIADAGREPGIYLCPHRRCLRYQWADDAALPPPVCDLDGAPLKLKNL